MYYYYYTLMRFIDLRRKPYILYIHVYRTIVTHLYTQQIALLYTQTYHYIHTHTHECVLKSFRLECIKCVEKWIHEKKETRRECERYIKKRVTRI